MGREEFKWVDIKDAVKLNFVKYPIQLFNLGSLCNAWKNTSCCKSIYEQLLSQSSDVIGIFNSKTDNTGAQDAKPSQHYKYHRGLLGRMQTIVNIIAKTPPKQR